MGRTLVFLARMMEGGKVPEARAIAIDERTAVLTEPDGHIAVEGDGSVYFIRAQRAASICKPGTPLTMSGISVYRVGKGGDFDIKSWSGHGGAEYTFDVDGGVIHSSQAGGEIY